MSHGITYIGTTSILYLCITYIHIDYHSGISHRLMLCLTTQ